MSDFLHLFDKRPILIVLAGPNGAGKSTFHETFLEQQGLQFVNADILARELGIDAYSAARVATSLREELVRQRVSFVFETVFSDPAGDKLAFMHDATDQGFTVVLCFIGISGPETSERRVAQRVIEGGHGVPADKLTTRFPRTLENLRRALRELPHVLVFDNDDLNAPYRLVATFHAGQPLDAAADLPPWLPPILP
jgi:predicted ABC-type ATPase